MPSIVPDILPEAQLLTCVSPAMTVQEACRLMAERSIAAVMVCHSNGSLAGIMTERDISARVVSVGLDPELTSVGSVMTSAPDTLSASDAPSKALRMMRDHNYRHLPVVDRSGYPIGMVSVRDLYDYVLTDMEYELQACETYITGGADYSHSPLTA